jgi:hypothetical protein
MKKGLLFAGASVLVLAAGYAWLSTAKPFEKKASVPAKSEAKSLFSAKAESISRLAVRRPDGSAYAFARKGEAYTLEGRPTIGLSASRVNSAFSAASSIEALQTMAENPPKLADFGLDAPALLSLKVEGGEDFSLEIGAKSPGGDYYARLPGERIVYSVSAASINSFYGELDEFRDKALPSIDPQKLRYLRIKRRDATIEIENRKGQFDDFYLTSIYLRKPFRHLYPVSLDGYDALLQAMPGVLAASRFVDAPKALSTYGLDPPLLEITLRDEANELRLLAGREESDGMVFAKLAGKDEVFTISRASIDFALKAEPFKLVNHLPLLVPMDNVDKISLKTAEKSYLFDLKRKQLPAAQGAVPGAEKPLYETSCLLNGVALGEDSFKQIYQTLIGIAVEAANPKALNAKALSRAATVTFQLKGGKQRSFDFVSASSDFYALVFDGDAEFLVTKSQLNAVIARLEEAATAK